MTMANLQLPKRSITQMARRIVCGGMVTAIAGLSGCAAWQSSGQLSAFAPPASTVPTLQQESHPLTADIERRQELAHVVEAPQPAEIQPAAYSDSASESQGVARVEGRRPADQPVTQTNYSDARRNAPTVSAISFTPAEARRTVDCPPGSAGIPNGSSLQFPTFPQGPDDPADYSDEFLCDGGDRANPVHYDRFNRLGLDTEDTVAEFVDHRGGRHVKATNQVCIYSPRFGAVQTVSMTSAGTGVERAVGAHDSLVSSGLRNLVVPSRYLQNERPGGVRMRSRAGGLDSETRRMHVVNVARVSAHTKLINLYQDIAFLRTGNFKQSDQARLANHIQAALAWSQDAGPVIAGVTASLQEVYGSFRPEEIVGIEDDHKTDGDLRIVKLADKRTAKPGDIVTFTLRYDNLGDKELNHIRIVDNLTPRLEYIEDSAVSDREGTTVVEDNGEGSLVIRFELDESLPGKTGGVITFQTRVR